MRKEVIGDATLYLGDCLEILPTLPKVDAVITDPPYLNLDGSYVRDYQGGVGAKHTATKSVGDEWGATPEWIAPAAALARSGLMVFCSFSGAGEFWEELRKHSRPIALVTWYKRNSAPTGKNVPYYTTEFVWCFRKEPGLKWDSLPIFIDEPNINPGCMATERLVGPDLRALHPSQKPLQVMRRLILEGANLILDPFMGTGTTGVAAVEFGRSFIGIERELRYFDIACNRIEQAYKQRPLFEAEPAPQPVQLGLEVS